MTFEEWKRRPVYLAQCRTWAKADELGVICHQFRCLPPYRDARALAARQRVAEAICLERRLARTSRP